MPNHITTVITAEKEVLDRLVHFNSEEEKAAHREKHAKAVAIRDELRKRIAGPDGKNDMEKFQALTDEEREAMYYYGDAELPDFYVDFNRVIPQPPNIEKGGCTGQHAEGVICWYSWSIKNWGTKWGAYSAELVEGGVKFETAWSHPFPIVQALSRSFPDQVIEAKYADEDTSSNLGWYWVKNGLCVQYARIVQGTTQAYSHAIWVNGSYGGSLETMLDEWYGDVSYIEDEAEKAEAIEKGKEERADFLARLKEMDRKAGVGDGEPALVVVDQEYEFGTPEEFIAGLEELSRRARNGEGIYEAEHAVKNLSSPDADGNGTVECVCGKVFKWGPAYGTAHELFGKHAGKL